MKSLCKFYEFLIVWVEVIHEYRKLNKSKYY
jgi:hypothetical protein